MSLTPYHTRYLAHELTKRCPSDSVEKLAPVLADAQVDLNPHQMEARPEQSVEADTLFVIRWKFL